MLATQMRMAAAGVTGGGADWWVVAGKTCVAAYQPIGAASLAASYTNLANPGTYDAAPGVAPTHASATGWTFNGTNQYLTTGVTPGSGGDWSMIVRFSDAATTDRVVAGCQSTTSFRGFALWPILSTTNRFYQNDGTKSVSGAQSAATMAICGQTAYLNGSSDGALSATTAPNFDNAILLGARNGAFGIDGRFPGKIQAVAIYSDTLSGAEVAILSAAMAALT